MADEALQQETEEITEINLPDENDSDSVSVDETESEVEASSEDSEKNKKEEEIEDYSDSVQKRINKLTYKIREAERREAAAVDYAKKVQDELNNTKQTLSLKDKNLYDEYSARVASELKQAEDNYKKAYDLGDTDAVISAQKDIAKYSVELESLNRVKSQQEQQVQPNANEQIVQPEQQNFVQQEQPSTPDPKAQEWAKKNDWFGQDVAMTTSAFAFHRQLVETEGYDPQSDEYYDEIDKRMRESFPHKLGNVSQNNVQDNVAVSSKGVRGNNKKGRTVKLTPSQVAIAKRLGVPLEEYAKYVK